MLYNYTYLDKVVTFYICAGNFVFAVATYKLLMSQH